MEFIQEIISSFDTIEKEERYLIVFLRKTHFI